MNTRLVTILGAVMLAASPAVASDVYPSRPVRIIVNSSPGALLDATTRAVAQKMAEHLGQPIVVENRAGADGLLGIRYVKAVPADGYTLLASANTIAQAPALKVEPGYDLSKDFIGIGMMNQAPLLLVGAPSQPFRTLPELVAAAKAKPDAMSFASGGLGTSTHMAAALFLHQAGVRMLHVPYKGNAAAMPDVISGRVNMIFDGLNSSGPQVKDGKLRAFGVTSAKRLAGFPDIPTLAEQGMGHYSFTVYMGLVAPAGTPREVVQRLAQALKAAQDSEPVRDRFRRDGAEPGTLSPEGFTEFLRRDMQRTLKVASDLGMAKE
ncbi:MAG TPA: tripartite tricarboxylate transporter substrate binding protein [Ramlibacter sp.]|nr:tripartite tricarboxylate transporter substrate binding protein [Ramlibacter sp.]